MSLTPSGNPTQRAYLQEVLPSLGLKWPHTHLIMTHKEVAKQSDENINELEVLILPFLFKKLRSAGNKRSWPCFLFWSDNPSCVKIQYYALSTTRVSIKRNTL